MKRFTKIMYDGLRSSVQQPKVEEITVVETLQAEAFQTAKTVRHGFPYQPTAIAFDPIQRILAVGTKQGSLRVIGRPGVDVHVKHEGDPSVVYLAFLINEGALVSATSDDALHLWTLRQKTPQILHTLKFQRERITTLHLPFQSKWLYLGTERGNIHIVNIETFTLSGYTINWNKAIELSRKTHPGAVVHLSDCPVDPGKLLIGYESGQLVIWDFKGRVAEIRFQSAEPLRSVSWHHEGKQFMCSHMDGSLTTWTLKQNSNRPTSTVFPHAKTGKEPCKPIQKVEWKSSKTGESFVVFSGGLAVEKTGRTPSITVVQGKTTTVLEMEHNVVDFVTLCENPYASEISDPYALVVLLQNDLVVVDLLTPGYPCFENPYSMDIHESPVTCCTYLADCPADLTPALYSAGARGGHRKQGFSDKEWPICGGAWGATSCPYPEMILTGHADGSIKFWDASSVGLQILYKVKTAKVFEKPRTRSIDGEEDPFAVHHLSLCAESRLLGVAGATAHVLLFRFCKQETTAEIPCLEIPILYEGCESGDGSPEYDFPPRPNLQGSVDYFVPIHVRSGPQRRPAGYQVELVCLTPWVDGEPPGGITTLAINSSYGLLAYGNESGLVVVDYLARTCLLTMGTPDLYGSADPYQRAPRSPKRAGGGGEDDRCKSPASDQDAREVGGSTFYIRSEEAEEEGEEEEEEEEEEEKRKKKKIFDGKKIKRFFSFKVDKEEKEEEEEEVPVPRGNMAPGTVLANESEGMAASDTLETPTTNQSTGSPQTASQGTGTSQTANQGTGTSQTASHSPGTSQTANQGTGTSQTANQGTGTPQTASQGTGTSQTANQGTEDPQTASERTASPPTANHSPEQLPATNHSPEQLPATNQSPEQLPAANQSPGQSPAANHSPATTQATVFLTNQSPEAPDSSTNHNTATPHTPPELTNERPAFPEAASKEPERSQRLNLTLYDLAGTPVRPPRKKKLRGVLTSDLTPPTSQVKPLPPPSPPSWTWKVYRKDKLDGSFSRSRSSSISSLENISSEAIQCLAFADTYTRKNDSTMMPTLWVGTSLGSVIQVTVLLPPADIRSTTPASVNPSGTIFRVKGSVVTMSFLDCSGGLIPHQYESWRDAQKEKRTPPKSAISASPDCRMSPTNSGGEGGSGTPQTPPPPVYERQFVVIASEKVARVLSLPTQSCVFKQTITEASFVVKAQVVTIKDSVSLVCYVASGHISVFSLPSLRQLIYVDFLPLVDLRIARTFCFTHHGHGLYLCSPSEIQKFTISTDFCGELQELLGHVFMPKEMPEAPKQSFFRGLFGGGVNQLDREELFGEASGKGSRSVAKHIGPGPSSVDPAALSARAGAATSDISRAKMLAIERGQKLGELEERTARMVMESESFSTHAHNLMMKYRDKKWYQL